MKTIIIGEQYTIDGKRILVKRNIFNPLISALIPLVLDQQSKCEACGIQRMKKNLVNVVFYSSPWIDGDPDVNAYYCQSCLDQGHDRDNDFAPEYCESCEREIAQRCFSNGYRGHFKWLSDTRVCVRCYQEHYLENGISFEEVEDHTYGCDFYTHDELREAGFVAQEDFTDDQVAALDAAILAAIDAGDTALVDQGRTSILGPDYVTLWVKPYGYVFTDNGQDK